MEKRKIKCKDCPYYTGSKCHGHGEYYGECLLFKVLKPAFSNLVSKEEYYYLVPKGGDLWSTAIFNEGQECMFFELGVG